MRTVESAHPTACSPLSAWMRRFDDCGSHEVGRSLSPLRHISDAHRKHLRSHILPLLILVQLPVHVELKVDDLVRRQGSDHLALVRRSADDGLPWSDLPLVDALVCEDVSDTAGVDLKESVVAELLHSERRS